MGKKKQPHYRIVVADSRAPRDGRFVENIGYYNPLKHPDGFRVDVERVDYWIGEGAIPSATVKSLVSQARSARSADPAGAGDAPDAGGRSMDADGGRAAEEASAAGTHADGKDSAQPEEAESEGPAAATVAEGTPTGMSAPDASPAGESAAHGSPAETSPEAASSA